MRVFFDFESPSSHNSINGSEEIALFIIIANIAISKIASEIETRKEDICLGTKRITKTETPKRMSMWYKSQRIPVEIVIVKAKNIACFNFM